MENTENQEVSSGQGKKGSGQGSRPTEGEDQQKAGESRPEDGNNKRTGSGEGQNADSSEFESEEKRSQEGEDSYKSKFYYLAAEIENQRKRFQKEKEGLLKFGNEKLLLDLIEVVDNFDRTLAAMRREEDKKVQNMVAGIDMVNKQLLSILQKHGLTPVESIGKDFDPNFHEAVSQKEVSGKRDQEILEEFQRGYVLNGRLLRPAKVVVAKSEEA